MFAKLQPLYINPPHHQTWNPQSLYWGPLLFLFFSTCNAANSNLFREYIGAESDSLRFSDVPINSDVEFHFILAFVIDYSTGSTPLPTNGKFNVFWETNNLGPSNVASIKNNHRNVKIAISLGGDSVGGDSGGQRYAYFQPQSISSWVQNAVSSLTKIIKQYNLDGIDIDYEHFNADPNTFVECIGQLVTTLKNNRVISFASIAPYDDDGPVQSHYLALWRKYGHVIDYVNFQFYAYDMGISISEFLRHVDKQVANYKGGKVLVSFISDGSGGLGPQNGFFEACNQLKMQGKLEGIFVWSAEDYQMFGFRYEKQSQELLGLA